MHSNSDLAMFYEWMGFESQYTPPVCQGSTSQTRRYWDVWLNSIVLSAEGQGASARCIGRILQVPVR